jgi:hypothetical protein
VTACTQQGAGVVTAAMLTPCGAAGKQANPKTPSPNTVLLPPDESSPHAGASAGRTMDGCGSSGGTGRAGGSKRAAAAAGIEAGHQQRGHGGGGSEGWHKQARVGAEPEVTLPTGVVEADGGSPSPWPATLSADVLQSLLPGMATIPWRHAGMQHAALTLPQVVATNPHQFPQPPQYSNPAYQPLLQQMQMFQAYYNAAAAQMGLPLPPQTDPTAVAAAHVRLATNAHAGGGGLDGGGMGSP